jgi:hypothetical protein
MIFTPRKLPSWERQLRWPPTPNSVSTKCFIVSSTIKHPASENSVPDFLYRLILLSVLCHAASGDSELFLQGTHKVRLLHHFEISEQAPCFILRLWDEGIAGKSKDWQRLVDEIHICLFIASGEIAVDQASLLLAAFFIGKIKQQLPAANNPMRTKNNALVVTVQ